MHFDGTEVADAKFSIHLKQRLNDWNQHSNVQYFSNKIPIATNGFNV